MRILVGGGGQVAELIARRLIREGNELVLVDQDAERCRLLEERLDARVVQGSIASISTLQKAGLADAEMLLAITTSDEANILACMIAQVESNVRVKVVRLRTHEVAHWKRVAEGSGLKIDLIIHPETDLSERIMRVVGVPGVSDIVDFFDGNAKLFGMNVDADSWAAGKTLTELDRANPPKNSLIAMIFRGQQVIIPHGAEVLKPGDHIYCITTKQELDDSFKFMGLERRSSLDRAFIVGGKQIGILLAQQLEAQNVSVKLFEQDIERCRRIASILKKTVVIHGDGTDQGTLQEANIQGADAFLALTNDDEDNVLASLMARKLGVKKVVALINRLHYLPMVQLLGINATVSPRLTAVDRILQFVRKGKVISVTTFREEEAEAIELVATRNSKYVGKALRELRFPAGAIVGAIQRPDGRIVVPRGEETIHVGDRVIFFALERVIPQLEASF
ncbi:MAG: Trk system potassium transporter TrkA [Acidobacteria bacterium]|nr:Trk system potassium transporter TrkA [Acidobacteriota bacterium]